MEDLMKRKEEIERELSLHSQTLEQNNSIGMNGPLVDREGFPRNDINIYDVRHARNRIICLRNDHKELMKLIEHKLTAIHSQARDTKSITSSRHTLHKHTVPFAHVTMVTEGSPAYNADIRVGDKVVEFGSVNNSNFTSMSDISTVIQHSIQRPVIVALIRDTLPVHVSVTPQQWAGKGLLGCVISPL